MWNALFRTLTELSSRPSIARLAGAFAKAPASRRLIRRFAAHYNIAIEEAEHDVDRYPSLNEFFIRRLKPGARPVDPGDRSVVSPVDGTVAEAGVIDAERSFLVKGQRYTVEELLNGSPHAARYRNGGFAVIYLSPANYHRIHAPADAAVIEVDRIPGKVYPVNDPSLRLMRLVLSRNARLVTYLDVGGATLALVKVGAMNVGSIRYVAGERPPERVAKGEELAYFEFGSTVVLLWERGRIVPSERLKAGASVRMGEKIGEIEAVRG
ncbi:archaetidylserine decarboxylase [Paenibacillus sp.]|uniref:archaetidylserine decarboxylase n=1 Tax=Paenibacillus sp. TaxID=58172 RepID=UPI002D41FBF4|nr:archaetidylserine decarboxylase [Paenibacillus sp.]HZG58241.1 archaetidylserine decarboxylase [Paenibacillus sp.]